MKTPDKTTAQALPRFFKGEVLADSASLQWSHRLASWGASIRLAHALNTGVGPFHRSVSTFLKREAKASQPDTGVQRLPPLTLLVCRRL